MIFPPNTTAAQKTTCTYFFFGHKKARLEKATFFLLCCMEKFVFFLNDEWRNHTTSNTSDLTATTDSNQTWLTTVTESHEIVFQPKCFYYSYVLFFVSFLHFVFHAQLRLPTGVLKHETTNAKMFGEEKNDFCYRNANEPMI